MVSDYNSSQRKEMTYLTWRVTVLCSLNKLPSSAVGTITMHNFSQNSVFNLCVCVLKQSSKVNLSGMFYWKWVSFGVENKLIQWNHRVISKEQV